MLQLQISHWTHSSWQGRLVNEERKGKYAHHYCDPRPDPREPRRARRAGDPALERELASYNSPSDLDDLHAILDRYSAQETAQIRRILASQQVG